MRVCYIHEINMNIVKERRGESCSSAGDKFIIASLHDLYPFELRLSRGSAYSLKFDSNTLKPNKGSSIMIMSLMFYSLLKPS